MAPGSARIIACLQEHREQLSAQCGARLFQHEVRLAEDIGELGCFLLSPSKAIRGRR